MTDKAYIVANEQQECKVIDKIKQSGVSPNGNSVIDTFVSSLHEIHSISFPYVIHDKSSGIGFDRTDAIYNHRQAWNVVYDGRKENKMKISKDVYDALVEWRDANHLYHTHINGGDLLRLPTFILNFWLELGISQNEANNRLIAIIRWVNGEDVFEVEKPKKWVVRSKETDDDNDHWYVRLPNNIDGINDVVYYMSSATLFNTKEEAQSWANSHQEVVEVEG